MHNILCVLPYHRTFQVLVLLCSTISSAYALACNSTLHCQNTFGYDATKCVDGQCSNPFHRGGCLKNAKTGWNKLRVCNSEDAPDAAIKGHCRLTSRGLSYTEVRIHGQNWESSFFMTWVLQILLSEVLNVPTTVETGMADTNVNLYHPENTLGYGNSNDWDSMRVATTYRDCRLVPQSEDEYVSCSHVVLEVWYAHSGRELIEEKVIEPHIVNGALGQQSWFVPRFTGKRDATLLSHLGLMGEKNRRKLAEAFLRPTTWGDYCDLVSSDGCASNDGIARRPPLDDQERRRMFVQGEYTGHFRATDKNDCDANPTNCTGHIADFPCGWSSYVQAQTHHLGIALSSDGDEPGSQGYEFEQLGEIWAAANATKSDVIMQWWTPDRLERQYKNSEAEFIRITLPAPSQECAENRVSDIDRCSAVYEERVGNKLGACAEEPQQVLKMLTTELERQHEESLEGTQSPAYETIHNFQITDLQVGRIFDIWTEFGREPSNFDPRDATCQWVVDNLDSLMLFVPTSHPRVLQEVEREGPLLYTSIVFGIVATICSISAIVVTFRYRKHPVMVYAQIDFLWLILFGLLLVSIGSLVVVVPPTDTSCVSAVWLAMLGYTLELVPLIVKVAAINHLMTAAKKMRRVNLSRRSLFGAVALLSTLAVLFLTVWMIKDPPHTSKEIDLTGKVTIGGDTIVRTFDYCSSDSPTWSYVAVGWNALYLVIATVLAIQTRKVRQDFNESSTLAIMIYSHFVFVIFRIISQLLEGPLDRFQVSLFLSLILSCDAILTVCIYLLPKFLRVWGQIPSIVESCASGDYRTEFENSNSFRQSATPLGSFRNALREQRCVHCSAKVSFQSNQRAIDDRYSTSQGTEDTQVQETSQPDPSDMYRIEEEARRDVKDDRRSFQTNDPANLMDGDEISV